MEKSNNHLTHAIFPAGVVLLLMALTITACDDQSTRSSAGTGTMQVMLHDNPGDFQEVWVDVQRVEVNNQDDEGNGANPNTPYLLKPVIRAYAQAETGTISGIIEPAEAEPWIYAIVDEDTVSSTRSEATTGEFQLLGLPADTYEVSIVPASEDYQSHVESGVEVTAGEDTDLGTIELDETADE